MGILEGCAGSFAREDKPALIGDQQCLMLILATVCTTTCVSDGYVQIRKTTGLTTWLELVEQWRWHVAQVVSARLMVVLVVYRLAQKDHVGCSLVQHRHVKSRQGST